MLLIDLRRVVSRPVLRVGLPDGDGFRAVSLPLDDDLDREDVLALDAASLWSGQVQWGFSGSGRTLVVLVARLGGDKPDAALAGEVAGRGDCQTTLFALIHHGVSPSDRLYY